MDTGAACTCLMPAPPLAYSWVPAVRCGLHRWRQLVTRVGARPLHPVVTVGDTPLYRRHLAVNVYSKYHSQRLQIPSTCRMHKEQTTAHDLEE